MLLVHPAHNFARQEKNPLPQCKTKKRLGIFFQAPINKLLCPLSFARCPLYKNHSTFSGFSSSVGGGGATSASTLVKLSPVRSAFTVPTTWAPGFNAPFRTSSATASSTNFCNARFNG